MSITQGSHLIAFPDHDLHNDEAIQHISRFENFDSIIDVFVHTRTRLLEMINRVESDIKFTVGSGKRQFTIESYISIFSKHDTHHLKQIRDKLNGTNR